MSISSSIFSSISRTTRFTSRFSAASRHCSPLSSFKSHSVTTATQSDAAQKISQVAQSEGGTTQGSTSAQMQSELTRARNFEQAAQEVGQKMQNDPQSVTSEDAAHLESKEHKHIGVRPPTDSISADAKRMASANEQGRDPLSTINSNATQDPAIRSHEQKEANAQDAAATLILLQNDRASMTSEDANLLRSRETRAHGTTEKGGITAQVQHQAAVNEGATRN